jgi:hypothetical protein
MPMKIEPDTVYRFNKSGNLVRTVEPTDYSGKGSWAVIRVDTGKGMIVHGDALVAKDDPNWSEG